MPRLYQLATVLMSEGLQKHKEDAFRRAHEEATKALAAVPNFPSANLLDGRILAQLKQDDAAKAQFQQYVKLHTTDDPERQRVLRYVDNPELARARLAPAFAFTTLDGQHISMDDLQGKVVLMDFWATWCGPCIDELRHLRAVYEAFGGDSRFAMVSLSLDDSVAEVTRFLAGKNQPWFQAFLGPWEQDQVTKSFGIETIPAVLLLDPDGKVMYQNLKGVAIAEAVADALVR